MLKGVGAVLIGMGCLGLGLWKREQLCARVTALKDLQQILVLLKSEIRYGKATLPECCRQISIRLKEPFKGCLEEICRHMQENTGESFEKVFREHFESCLREKPLSEEEKELFLHSVTSGSFMDGKMQLCAIEKGEEALRQREKVLEKENVEKGRMVVGLGVLSGLFIIIILI